MFFNALAAFVLQDSLVRNLSMGIKKRGSIPLKSGVNEKPVTNHDCGSSDLGDLQHIMPVINFRTEYTLSNHP